ncbi:MAG: hypothetical protein M1820_009740 [Bogoriella megaspora]|nr:MAG: hypothetical protein M1820_009740 [Bogoriella megaspora]
MMILVAFCTLSLLVVPLIPFPFSFKTGIRDPTILDPEVHLNTAADQVGYYLSTVAKRAIDNEAWLRYVCQGDILLDYMQATDFPVKQSTWTSNDKLSDYGWQPSPRPAFTFGSYFQADYMLSSVGLPTENSAWTRTGQVHSSDYKIDEQDWKARQSKHSQQREYSTYTNFQAGAIYVVVSYSPDYKFNLARPFPPPYYPDPMLKRWSDVVFLAWQKGAQDAGVQVNSLRYFFEEDITNRASQDVIAEALRRVQSTGSDGQEFTADSNEGKAILATPNGRGKAFFLAQHKEALGRKTITRMRVWSSGMIAWRPNYNIIYFLEDA